MALRSEITSDEEVSMTPMIDIVFNLLIFFLLGSTYMQEERQLELKLPQVSEAAPLTAEPEEITVAVLADGRIDVKGETYTLELLKVFLEKAHANYPDQAVAVRGDAEVRYQAVADVIAVARQSGIGRLDVVVQEK